MKTILQARKLLQDNKLPECEALCKNQLAILTSIDSVMYTNIQVILASALLLQGESKAEARVLLDTAMRQKDRFNAEALTDLGGGWLLAGELSFAQTLLEKAIIDNPELAVAYARLSLVYMQSGDLQKALEFIDTALSLAPGITIVKLNKIRILLSLDQQSLAIDIFKSIHEEEVIHSFSVIEGYIEVLNQLGDPLPLDAFIQKVLALQENFALQDKTKLFHIQANIALSQDNFIEAESFYREGLKIDGNNKLLSLSLASLCEIKGRLIEAHAIYSQLIKIHTEDIPCWFALCNILIQLKHFPRASRSVEHVKTLIDTNKMPWYEAQRLSFKANIQADTNAEKAIQIYVEALTLHPQCLSAHQGLGHLYLLEGETDKAIEQFNLIEKISPMAGFASLATAKKFPQDEATLTKLEKIASLPKRQLGGGQAGIFFALASAREANIEYSKAFEWAVKANQCEEKHLDYQHDIYREHIKKIMQRYSLDFFKQRKNFGNPSKLPVFVLGMPRSGTTLVEQMLGGHPHIFAAGELGLVSSQIQTIKQWQKHIGSKREYPECVDELTPTMITKKANIHLTELQTLSQENNYIEDDTHKIKITLSNSLEETTGKEITRVIDKLPHNFENIGLIKLLFPMAKIIHCRRTPQAIALSNFFTNYQAKHGGMGFAYELTNIGHHIADHHQLMDHWHKVFPQQILEVNYEDLVDTPKQQAKVMLDYLGLQWSDKVLEHTQLKREVKTASVWQVRQPIYTSSKEKWHHYREALKPFDEAFKQGQDNWHFNEVTHYPHKDNSSLFNLALEHQHAQRYHQAEQGYRVILEKNPDHSGANYLLAGLGYLSGHFEESLMLYDKVKKTYQKLPAFHYNVALVYTALESWINAQRSLEIAIQLQPNNSSAIQLLSEISPKTCDQELKKEIQS